MLQKTYNLFDFLMRHSFHYWIWTFCALFIIFDKVLHMPLELLNNFNFIPEFLINLSKIINTQPVEVPSVTPVVNVTVDNQEILSALNQINKSLVGLNENLSNMHVKLVENNVLTEANTNTVLETSRALYNINQLLNENVVSTLSETNSLIKINTEAQINIAKRIIVNIKDVNTSLFNMQGSLSYLAFTQNQILSGIQSTQDLVLQSYSSILNNQSVNFDILQGETSKLFTKINDIRNHNVELYQSLQKHFDNKLLQEHSEIIKQIREEIARPKISTTQVNTNSSWFDFFNNKK